MLQVRAIVNDQVAVLNFVDSFHGFFIFSETVICLANHSIDFEVAKMIYWRNLYILQINLPIIFENNHNFAVWANNSGMFPVFKIVLRGDYYSIITFLRIDFENVGHCCTCSSLLLGHYDFLNLWLHFNPWYDVLRFLAKILCVLSC